MTSSVNGTHLLKTFRNAIVSINSRHHVYFCDFCRSVMWNVCLIIIIAVYQNCVDAFAVAPPSWSDPKVNPCANMPNGGWQHLYFAPLKECFKIFTLGYPCPDTMELSPILNGMTGHGECKCPPGTAQINATAMCYKIFDRGPCSEGHYLSPLDTGKGIK